MKLSYYLMAATACVSYTIALNIVVQQDSLSETAYFKFCKDPNSLLSHYHLLLTSLFTAISLIGFIMIPFFYSEKPVRFSDTDKKKEFSNQRIPMKPQS
jgi:hypothetical protein